MFKANELKRVCHNGTRFIPKRNRDWLKKKHPYIYEYISHNDLTISDNYILFSNGYNELPLCSVCSKRECIIYRGKLLDYCSNSCSIKSDKTQNKTEKTNIDRYGSKRRWGHKGPYNIGDHHLQDYRNLEKFTDKDFIGRISKKGWKYCADYFGCTTNSHSSVFRLFNRFGYNLSGEKSNLELELYTYVSSLIKCYRSDKSVITPYELDVYIPSKKLAIEFDGLYWHSAGCKLEESPDYHLMKTEMCEEKGIQLLHIFENEWIDPVKREIWKSVIRSKLGLNNKIYARKTKVREIPNKEANDFLTKNHLQGKCVCSRSKGLFYQGELVAVATFGKSRFSKGYTELIRLATAKGLTVVGGAGKLLKNETNLLSYANRRWSNGNVYDKLDFSLKNISKPCYWYVNRGRLYHRSSFMKHKLKDRLQKFTPQLTEIENCYNNGLRRIWDCGNYVYTRIK